MELADGATVGELKRALADQIPQLSDLLAQLKFAVGSDYVDEETILAASDDVACIPPVSGG
jgi:molybdopterin converting factor small subunit